MPVAHPLGTGGRGLCKAWCPPLGVRGKELVAEAHPQAIRKVKQVQQDGHDDHVAEDCIHGLPPQGLEYPVTHAGGGTILLRDKKQCYHDRESQAHGTQSARPDLGQDDVMHDFKVACRLSEGENVMLVRNLLGMLPCCKRQVEERPEDDKRYTRHLSQPEEYQQDWKNRHHRNHPYGNDEAVEDQVNVRQRPHMEADVNRSVENHKGREEAESAGLHVLQEHVSFRIRVIPLTEVDQIPLLDDFAVIVVGAVLKVLDHDGSKGQLPHLEDDFPKAWHHHVSRIFQMPEVACRLVGYQQHDKRHPWKTSSCKRSGPRADFEES